MQVSTFVYSIRDTVLDQFATPFLARNENHAVMQFEMAIAQARKSGFKQEFELWSIGKFDDVTGWLTADEPKKVNLANVEFDDDPQKELDL